jgi:mono/diheme cytochrome c family protein
MMAGLCTRASATLLLLALVACGRNEAGTGVMPAADAVAAATPAASEALPDATPLDGPALYKERCGMCHQTIGMAVSILSRRPADASKGLLEDRPDLSAAFINTVVRTGIMNMPRMSRGELSDPELASIAAYLSKGKP